MFSMNVGDDPIKLGENWLLLHLMLIMVYCDFVRSVQGYGSGDAGRGRWACGPSV